MMVAVGIFPANRGDALGAFARIEGYFDGVLAIEQDAVERKFRRDGILVAQTWPAFGVGERSAADFAAIHRCAEARAA